MQLSYYRPWLPIVKKAAPTNHCRRGKGLGGMNFSRFMVQDFDSLFIFLSLVERLTVSLRLLQCGYSFLPAKEIPDSLSGFIHNFFFGGEDMTGG